MNATLLKQTADGVATPSYVFDSDLFRERSELVREVVGDNIMIELDGQDGTIRLNGKIGYGANTLTLRLQGSYDDPISLSFQKIDLKYGKERRFYWPEAEL